VKLRDAYEAARETQITNHPDVWSVQVGAATGTEPANQKTVDAVVAALRLGGNTGNTSGNHTGGSTSLPKGAMQKFRGD
jgi:hypothetical protein